MARGAGVYHIASQEGRGLRHKKLGHEMKA